MSETVKVRAAELLEALERVGVEGELSDIEDLDYACDELRASLAASPDQELEPPPVTYPRDIPGGRLEAGGKQPDPEGEEGRDPEDGPGTRPVHAEGEG